MAELKSPPLIQLIISYFLSFVISVGVIFLLIAKCFKYGPRKVFCSKPLTNRPDALDDCRFGTHNFAELKNIKLHYVVNGIEKGPLMLLIHGFPEIWYSWRYQLLEFSKDYRVVAIDMRGYGQSGRPTKVRDYGLDRLTDDIYQLITYLGYTKATIACHDWGGVVGWNFALLHPQMVEKLIVCNCPHPSAFEEILRTNSAQRGKSWYLLLFLMPRLPEVYLRSRDYYFIHNAFVGEGGANQGSLTDEDIQVYKYSVSQPDALRAMVDYYRATGRYGPLNIDMHQKIGVPVLIVWGDGDAFLERRLAQMSAEYCDDCTVEYVAGVSHWVQQEEPDKVNKIIREYLARKV